MTATGRLLRMALAALLLAAPPAVALGPTSPPAATSTATPVEPAISSRADVAADPLLAQRIRGIFGEIPALGDVQVAVHQGVVTLAGKVPEDTDIARAGALAERVAGVVTVENKLERDLSIASQTGAVGRVRARIDGWVRVLPLVGVAFAVALAIGAIGYVLGGLGALWERLAPNSFLAELLAGLIRFVFAILGLVVALDMLGATALLGAVLGGAGVIGIALGFAMRDTIENYMASLLLSLRQPFRANDWVCIDGHEGHVIRLTSRATILMTLDGNQLRIPNAKVFTAVILNFTANPQRRFEFELGIDAADDPTAARRLGEETLAALPFVLADPPPAARVKEVGDSNIVLTFQAWVDQTETDWYKARSRAIPGIKHALESAGFALPEPIYRLRFEAEGVPPMVPARAMQGQPVPRRGSAIMPPAEATATPQDVAPERAITELVEDERRKISGKERDLLDPAKPVE